MKGGNMKRIVSIALGAYLMAGSAAFAQSPVQQPSPETYLFCKYNTYASDYNFLELSSNADATITGTIAYLSSTGVQIGATVPFSLNAFSRVDFDVHSVVGRSAYGQVLVGVNGDLADISGAVSYYKANGGNTLETVSISCTPRSASAVSAATKDPAPIGDNNG